MKSPYPYYSCGDDEMNMNCSSHQDACSNIDLGSEVKPIIKPDVAYEDLKNRPLINGIELLVDKKSGDLLIFPRISSLEEISQYLSVENGIILETDDISFCSIKCVTNSSSFSSVNSTSLVNITFVLYCFCNSCSYISFDIYI